MQTVAGISLFVGGISLVVWRRPITRWVVGKIAFGYGGLEEADPMMGPLSILTATAGILGILLGALLLLKILGV